MIFLAVPGILVLYIAIRLEQQDVQVLYPRGTSGFCVVFVSVASKQKMIDTAMLGPNTALSEVLGVVVQCSLSCSDYIVDWRRFA